ncbi:MFS transporter [Candidatus Marinamargulisbacteria bacterium SCGC AG-414-C22]|nr:MFS transporter [Candidatus Marinamargulisbacteria bacterium SCGC AG-414-C22]
MDTDGKQSLLSLIITIIIPSCILIFSKKFITLSPILTLIIALSFPFFYGAYELIFSKKWSWIALLGFISILLTGGIAVLKLPPQWIAIKESIIPFIIGMAFFISSYTKKPALFFILGSILDLDKIKLTLDENKKIHMFSTIIFRSNILLSLSFLVSTILNFLLAFFIVKSEPGSVAFNDEIGLMTALSYPVIALPSMIVMCLAIWYFVAQVKRHTSLTFENMVHQELQSKLS